jgi:hypothetical protein
MSNSYIIMCLQREVDDHSLAFPRKSSRRQQATRTAEAAGNAHRSTSIAAMECRKSAQEAKLLRMQERSQEVTHSDAGPWVPSFLKLIKRIDDQPPGNALQPEQDRLDHLRFPLPFQQLHALDHLWRKARSLLQRLALSPPPPNGRTPSDLPGVSSTGACTLTSCWRVWRTRCALRSFSRIGGLGTGICLAGGIAGGLQWLDV